MKSHPAVSRRTALILTVLLLAASGCSQRTIYPVEGRIVDPDGQPIPGLKDGAVEFESLEARSSASGDIREDGTFRLTTDNPGDGAWLGRHRVLIARRYLEPDRPAPRVIDRKYEQYETSGLEVTVKPENNTITLTVERLGAVPDDS